MTDKATLGADGTSMLAAILQHEFPDRRVMVTALPAEKRYGVRIDGGGHSHMAGIGTDGLVHGSQAQRPIRLSAWIKLLKFLEAC